MRVSVFAPIVVLAVSSLVACRGDRKDAAIDPNLVIAQVIINPPSTVIAVSQYAAFKAYGITVGGDSVPVAVDWTADGGTLFSNGTFSSAEPGLFQVIGRDRQAPHPADTVTVTVTATPVVLTSLVITPVAPIIAPGESRPFVVEGHFSDSSIADIPVTWSATGGVIDPNGLYTAGGVEGAFEVIATANIAAVAETVLVTINQTAPTVTSLTISPDTAAVFGGGTVQYQTFAQYTDGTFAPAAVTYTATGGSITAGGLLTASLTPGLYRVIARHQASGLADTAKMTVEAATLVSLSMTPPTAAITTGSSQQFTVVGTLSNGSVGPVAVNFSTNGGNITAGGLYTAGATPGQFLVIAQNPSGTVADTSTVTVNATNVTVTQIRIQPRSNSVLTGSSLQFSATARFSDGTQGPGTVNWSTTGGNITGGGAYTAPQVAGTYKVVARATSGNIADTVDVVVNSPLTLTSITVTPSSAALLTGAIQQFTAAGTLSNGASTAVNVTWTATGGVISGSGQYTAGNTAGNYRAIATQVGGTLADTATITVSNLPPPGSSNCGNEPPGLSVIFDTPWNAVPPVSPTKDQYGWSVRSAGELGKLSIFTDAAAPRTPSNTIAGKFPKGSRGGAAPFGLTRNFGQNVTTIYNCLFTLLDPLFTNNGNAGTKFGFLLTPYTSGSTSVNHYFNLTNNLGVNLQSSGATLNRNMLSSFSLVGHRGQWVKVEFLVIANTQGNSDGVARMWVNDAQVLNVTNVQYFFPSQNPAFNGITWNPTYGGGLNPVPYDMFHYIDNWYVSGR